MTRKRLRKYRIALNIAIFILWMLLILWMEICAFSIQGRPAIYISILIKLPLAILEGQVSRLYKKYDIDWDMQTGKKVKRLNCIVSIFWIVLYSALLITLFWVWQAPLVVPILGKVELFILVPLFVIVTLLRIAYEAHLDT